MKKGFYYVDEEYINFLKKEEVKHRGFTTVPNVEYANKSKFFYGFVFEVNRMNYYVPVTHFNKIREHSLLIEIENHKKKEIPGSLRFNYMIPVPKKCIRMLDLKDNSFTETEKIKLEKELKFCQTNLSRIQKLAKKAYQDVSEGKNKELLKNSCAFSVLEEAYSKFINDEIDIPQKSLYESEIDSSNKKTDFNQMSIDGNGAIILPITNKSLVAERIENLNFRINKLWFSFIDVIKDTFQSLSKDIKNTINKPKKSEIADRTDELKDDQIINNSSNSIKIKKRNNTNVDKKIAENNEKVNEYKKEHPIIHKQNDLIRNGTQI